MSEEEVKKLDDEINDKEILTLEREIFEQYKEAFKDLPPKAQNVLVALAIDVHRLKLRKSL